MGTLFKSALVIGVLVYLAPIRLGQAGNDAGHLPPLPHPPSFSDTAGAIWQKLPSEVKQNIENRARDQILDAARKELLTPKELTDQTSADSRIPGPAARQH